MELEENIFWIFILLFGFVNRKVYIIIKICGLFKLLSYRFIFSLELEFVKFLYFVDVVLIFRMVFRCEIFMK